MCHVYHEEVREQLCGLLFSLSLYLVLGTGLKPLVEAPVSAVSPALFPLLFVLHLGQLTPTVLPTDSISLTHCSLLTESDMKLCQL